MEYFELHSKFEPTGDQHRAQQDVCDAVVW